MEEGKPLLDVATVVTGTEITLTVKPLSWPTPVPVVPPVIPPTPPDPSEDWYSPEKYPPNPGGYVPIEILEPQDPINEFVDFPTRAPDHAKD